MFTWSLQACLPMPIKGLRFGVVMKHRNDVAPFLTRKISEKRALVEKHHDVPEYFHILNSRVPWHGKEVNMKETSWANCAMFGVPGF